MHAARILVLVAAPSLGACGSNPPPPGGPTPQASVHQCETGWTWDPNEQRDDGTRGGCVPPKSWPVATDCRSGDDSPPTCIRCDENPWAFEQNCPTVDGSTSYAYIYRGNAFCCVEPPA